MKKFLSVVIMLACFISLYADQAAWITKEQAERGAALIRASGEIRHFCAPCGDNFYRVETVSSVEAVKADGSNPADAYFEVLVNGNSVDLAYVYVISDGKWLNAAMYLNIPVEGVSKFLPSDLRNEEIDPSEIMEDYQGPGDYEGSSEDIPFEEGE